MMERRGNTIKIPDGYYTTKKLAAMVGKSEYTLRNWREAGHLPADEVMKAGKLTIYLYGPPGVKRAKELAQYGGKLPNGSLAA